MRKLLILLMLSMPAWGQITQSFDRIQANSVFTPNCVSTGQCQVMGQGTNTTLTQAQVNIGSNGGVVLFPAGFTYVSSATENITTSNLALVCLGVGPSNAQIQINHAATAFNITGGNFTMQGCDVKVTATATRNAVALIFAGAQVGRVENNKFSCNATSPDCGIIFNSTGNGTGTGLWTIDNNRVFPPGTTWTAFIKITDASGVNTSADWNVYNNIAILSTVYTDAAVVLDGWIDTYLGWANTYGNAPGTALWLRNTVGGGGCPQWVHETDTRIEGGLASGNLAAIRLDCSRDFRFQGYVATAGVGTSVGASAAGTDLHDIHYVNIGQAAITVTSGAINTNIHDNTFENTGVQTNNTYDTISSASGVTDINIHDNNWRATAANFPAHAINLNSGAGTRVHVTNNTYSAAVVNGGIFNLPSGADVQVYGNQQRSVGVADNFTLTSLFLSNLLVPEGTAPSGTAGQDNCYGDSTAHALECSYNNGTFFKIPQTIGSGTATMTTALIGTLACGTTVTVAASGVATTDAITWAFNAIPAANPGELVVSAWPTANNVNFQYCNPTAAGVTPNAATLNWRVVR